MLSMTREEFESALLEYPGLEVDAQAEKLVALVEAFQAALDDAVLARQERDDVKDKYMRDFLETAKEEGAETPAPLSDNNELHDMIAVEDYMDLG